MADISETLRHELRDAEYSEGYAESFLDAYIATQIKVLREQRDLTQKELAELLGTKQTVVSRIENVNYSSWNVTTLKKIARALKVRLRVSFETYGSLIDEVTNFSRASVQRVSRDEDPVLTADTMAVALPLGDFLPQPPLPRNAGNKIVFIDEEMRRNTLRSEKEKRDAEKKRDVAPPPRPVVPALALTSQQGARYGNISNSTR